MKFIFIFLLLSCFAATPYQVLGVPETATDAEIKKAFRALARKYHPDAVGDDSTIEYFKEISNAYDLIKTKEARLRYHRSKAAPTSSTKDPYNRPQNVYDSKTDTYAYYSDDKKSYYTRKNWRYDPDSKIYYIDSIKAQWDTKDSKGWVMESKKRPISIDPQTGWPVLGFEDFGVEKKVYEEFDPYFSPIFHADNQYAKSQFYRLKDLNEEFRRYPYKKIQFQNIARSRMRYLLKYQNKLSGEFFELATKAVFYYSAVRSSDILREFIQGLSPERLKKFLELVMEKGWDFNFPYRKVLNKKGFYLYLAHLKSLNSESAKRALGWLKSEDYYRFSIVDVALKRESNPDLRLQLMQHLFEGAKSHPSRKCQSLWDALSEGR